MIRSKSKVIIKYAVALRRASRYPDKEAKMTTVRATFANVAKIHPVEYQALSWNLQEQRRRRRPRPIWKRTVKQS